MPLIVRPTLPEDLPALDRLASYGFESWRGSFGAELVRADRQLWSALDDHLVGFAVVQTLLDEAELQLVLVAPDLRRQGIGGQLMQVVEAGARAKGAGRLLLEVAQTNAAARALYQKRGFKEDGRRRRYYANGDDAVLMSLVL